MLKASLVITLVFFIAACAQTPVETIQSAVYPAPEADRVLDMYVFPQQAGDEGHHLQVTY